VTAVSAITIIRLSTSEVTVTKLNGVEVMLRNNIKAMKRTMETPSWVQVMVNFEMAADEIAKLERRLAEREDNDGPQ